MMRFTGKGIVWSPEDDRPVCKFVKGVFETDDEELIEVLEELGYEGEEVESDELVDADETDGDSDGTGEDEDTE